MSFKEDHPKYKTYKSEHLHYSELPYQFSWDTLESLIDEAGGPDRESLATVVQKIATKARAGSVSTGTPYSWIEPLVSKIKKQVGDGKFDVLMDCLAILCDDGELKIETLNEFLEEYCIGYKAYGGLWNHGIVWEKVEDKDESEDVESISPDNAVLFIPEAKLITSKEEMKLAEKEAKDKMRDNKPTKIFVTHSSKDKAYVLLLTELLRNLKISNDSIVCTSDPRHKIPNGRNAYEWLKEQFIESNIHMIFVLSENYYGSNACLNEMGAAWLVAQKSDILLLPGFGFDNFKQKEGCLDKEAQGGSIDSDDRMLKAWLKNLRDDVIKEFGLAAPDELDWEEYRNKFIAKIRAVKLPAE